MSVVARVQEHELGETDKALETNRRILALRPDDPQAIDALERLYLAKQRYTDLLAIYDKKLALIQDPTAKKDIQLKVGQLYEDEIGDDGKAIAAYRAILKESGDELPALAALHRIHERKNEWAELADVVERELAVTSRSAPDANHIGLKFRLGQVREQHLGDVVGAIACYQQILQTDPSHEGARAALEKRLPSSSDEAHQRRAADILEPIYELLEAWVDLAAVHEIQLKHERSLERRVGLLMRVGELPGDQARRRPGRLRRLRPRVPRGPVARFRARRARAHRAAHGRRRQRRLAQARRALRGRDRQGRRRAGDGDRQPRHPAPPRALDQGRRGVRRAPRETPPRRSSTTARRWRSSPTTRRRSRRSTASSRARRSGPISSRSTAARPTSPRDPDERLNLLFRIASLWEEMLQSPEEAITTYKEILGHDPVNMRALRALDRLYLAQKHWQDLGDNLVRQLALVA